VGVIAPDPAVKAQLLTLGTDIINSWYTGTTDEYYNPATRIWNWNAAEAGNDNDWDVRLGLSTLCAALSRYKTPYDVHQRLFYRRLAIETVDQWFLNQQDTATGGIWRTSLANLVGDSGTCTFFGLHQVAMIAKLLNLRTRWATQIAAALDYTTGRGELTYYTNGNIMLLKLISYELGAWATGDAGRRTQVENLWSFTLTPTAYMAGLGSPNLWRGAGLRDEGGGKGYLSETSSTGSGIDLTAANVLDWIYTDAQSVYAGSGYLLFGDARYATMAQLATLKMYDRYNFTTNQFDFSGGSRNAGPGVRNIYPVGLYTGAWMLGDATHAANAPGTITKAATGLDADFRNYLNISHSTFVRGFGVTVAGAIIAAHGVPL
jgi:hypothetical protein